MAFQPTGRNGLNGKWLIREYADPVTGEVQWQNVSGGVMPAPASIYGSYDAGYLNAVPNTVPAGGTAQLSEAAAQADPRGTMSNVIRGMSDDFFKTAIPVKDDLIKMTTYNGNKGVVDGLKSQGVASADQSFDNAQGQATRNTQRYGMNLTKEQGEAQASALSSGKALAEVDASNRATLFQQDLNKQLVSGMGSPAGITK